MLRDKRAEQVGVPADATTFRRSSQRKVDGLARFPLSLGRIRQNSDRGIDQMSATGGSALL
jgi:hypothetical protein